MSDEAKNEEKKIFVDEDWKGRVAAEKEAARQTQGSAESSQAEATAGTAPLPSPNLTVLASSLYLQGMICLGLLPGPGSEPPEEHLDQAKHAIDMLQVLYDKTAGNRTPEETAEMDRMLHEARMVFIAVQQKPPEPPA